MDTAIRPVWRWLMKRACAAWLFTVSLLGNLISHRKSRRHCCGDSKSVYAGCQEPEKVVFNVYKGENLKIYQSLLKK